MLEQLGDKTFARNIAEKIGVPVLGEPAPAVASVSDGERFAAKLGYPIILKAAKGGGGGMRVQPYTGRVCHQFRIVQRESLTAFGSPDIFIEKFIEHARHIEVQLLGDKHGNLVHLFESAIARCNVGIRRWWKLLQRRPSIPPCAMLRDAVLAIGREVNYAAARAPWSFSSIGIRISSISSR